MAAKDTTRIALATTWLGASIMAGSACSAPEEVGQPEPTLSESAAKTSCDVDRRGDALRISPHFFNNEADIDRCFEELARLL